MKGGLGLIAAPFIAKGIGEAGSAVIDTVGEIPIVTQAARAVKEEEQKLVTTLKQ